MNVRPKNKESENSYNLRIFLLMVVIVAFVGIIILRLFSLQVLNHNYYLGLASGQHNLEQVIAPKRGEIFLTSQVNNQSVVVATNVDMNLVYAVPKEIKSPAEVAAKLGPLLGLKPQDILQHLTGGNENYVVLKRQLTDNVSKLIVQEKISGIYLEAESVRVYPEQNLAANVLGFLGFNGQNRVGQYGIEGKFQKQLAGVPGLLGAEKDVAGRLITFAQRNLDPAVDGDSFYLTLDPSIQLKAQEVLQKTVTQHGADSGSVVVMNPKTGAIMAMANMPDFDPNVYSKAPNISVYSNEATSGDYEPGSIFKAVTMAAALNENKITPDTTYNDTGSQTLNNFTIKDSDGLAHGIQTMTQVLEESLNLGAVFAQQQLGQELFRQYVTKFGFGKPSGIELPSESSGNTRNLNQKGDIFFATASFGQGISVTPLQMVRAYTAIANGGKMMKPYIIDKITHPDGTSQTADPQTVGQVIDPKTASTLSAMLVDVVENGHGKKAAVKGYYIAGKTGTAQVANSNKTGYDPNKNIGSFVGFGPVDNPVFVMIVRIDNPKDVKFAESTAAPAFGEIASFILNYLQIPPSR